MVDRASLKTVLANMAKEAGVLNHWRDVAFGADEGSEVMTVSGDKHLVLKADSVMLIVRERDDQEQHGGITRFVGTEVNLADPNLLGDVQAWLNS